MSEYVLELHDIVKTFGSTVALNGMHFQLKPGEVHALMGENGAGKSTFIKIITGVYQPDSGSVVLNGKPVTVKNTTDSQKKDLGEIVAATILAAAAGEYDGKLDSSFSYNGKTYTTVPAEDGGTRIIGAEPFFFYKENMAEWVDVL